MTDNTTAPKRGRRKPKTNRKANASESKGYDRCQTPGYALEPLYPYLDPTWAIWEPAMGKGNIVAQLRGRQHTVLGTDILTGQNFFTTEPEHHWDILITNPPYSVKYPWIKRCYQLGKPFALLVPIDVHGAAAAQILFDQYGVQTIYTRPRINFEMPIKGLAGSNAQFSTCWITWQLNLPKDNLYTDLRRVNQPVLFV